MRSVILNFHGIGEPSRKLEPGEAPYWVSPSYFEDVLKIASQLKGQVSTDLTFDDGNTSDISLAAPLLARYDVCATFFVLSSRLDKPGSLSSSDLRHLVSDGHKIGSHGADHVDWTALGPDEEHREWTEARDMIANAANQDIDCAAIPFGRYRKRVLCGLKANGFSEIYSSDGGAWHGNTPPIPRTSPRCDMSLETIKALLLGHETARQTLRRRFAMAVKRRI